MPLRQPSRIRHALSAFLLVPLLAVAAEGTQPVTDPNAAHPATAPVSPHGEAVTPQTPAPVEPEAPKTEAPSGKGLVVNRAPDFCMKKDPPPHCAE